MMNSTASLDLVEYVETNILPRYAAFDKAHGLSHVMRVIRKSLDLARVVGADRDMVYVVAAYHDLGLDGPRAIHHITGGRILERDARLRKWFSEEQIKIMKEAVEDHRASASRSPRSVYGKIVAEADRDLDPAVVLRRAVQFGLDNYPQLDREGQWQRFRAHVVDKYSVKGYIRLWLPQSPNEENLRKLRELIANQSALRAEFDRIFAEEVARNQGQ